MRAYNKTVVLCVSPCMQPGITHLGRPTTGEDTMIVALMITLLLCPVACTSSISLQLCQQIAEFLTLMGCGFLTFMLTERKSYQPLIKQIVISTYQTSPAFLVGTGTSLDPKNQEDTHAKQNS